MLSGSKLFDVLKTMLTNSKTIDLERGFSFIEEKAEDIEADVNQCNFLRKASIATCRRHIRDAKTMFQCFEAYETCSGWGAEAIWRKDVTRIDSWGS